MTKFEGMAARYIQELPLYLQAYAVACIDNFGADMTGLPPAGNIGERIDIIRDVHLMRQSAGQAEMVAHDDGSRARYRNAAKEGASIDTAE